MRKGVLLLALPLALTAPLVLLILGIGGASVDAVRAACTSSGGPPVDGSFRVGTLNWRGASHYHRNPHPGERPYDERVPNMVAKIGASGASIIGFQELEPPQATAFLDATGGAWAIVPGQRDDRTPSTANAIAYQPAVWRVEEVGYVPIRYGGPIIGVPLVRFTPTTSPPGSPSGSTPGSPPGPTSGPTSGSTSGSPSGPASIWVLNTHHPADAVGGSDALRDAAVRAEADALGQLQSHLPTHLQRTQGTQGTQGTEPTTPVVLVGDMNDRTRFKQRFLSLAGPGWSTANPTDDQIDWIVGGPGVTFADTVVDRSTNDNARRYTDHPFITTTVTNPLTGTGTAAHATEPTVSRSIPSLRHTSADGSTGGLVGQAVTANVVPRNRVGAIPGVRPTSRDLSEGAAHRAQPSLSRRTRPPTRTTLSARQAGANEDRMRTAIAVAGVESARNPDATTGDRWWQVDDSHRGLVPARAFIGVLNSLADRARQAAPAGGSAPGATTENCGQLVGLQQLAELSRALRARVEAMMGNPHGLCALSWTRGAPCTYDNQCPKVVDALYGGPGVGRGYGDGQHVAQGIIDAGLAQSHGTGLDPLPPVGAVVSYDTGDGVGHVAVYVGGGKIFGNDYGCAANGVFGCVGFADVTTPGGSVTWALPAPAFDLGGSPATAS